jgi:hypothetical protein
VANLHKVIETGVSPDNGVSRCSSISRHVSVNFGVVSKNNPSELLWK